MARVYLEHVTKHFRKGKVVAVKDITFEVKDKEFIVLVGPSGCGKTTTLRMIAGLEDITEGSIYIGDRIVNDVPPKNRDIAMVFQNYALYPHMTVYENMAFGLKLRRYPKSEIEKRVKEAARMLGLGNLLDRLPKELSGGQRQRAALGRAIVRQPKAFLLDEPLSNLDAKLRVQMRKELSRLHQRLEATMIYVTHDQVEAMTLGDRIVVMDNGVIQQIDTPLNLYDNPANKFVAGFIGSPPINFINCRVIKKEQALWLDEGTFQAKVPPEKQKFLEEYVDKEVSLGVRPEDIYPPGFAPRLTHKASFSAVVELIEPLGNENLIYLNTGKHPLISRVGKEEVQKVTLGEKIEYLFDMEKARVFDNLTENRII